MMQEKESGRILQCIGGIYTVATDSGTVSCKARGVFRKRGMTPYAGDFVTVEQGVMTEILPRKKQHHPSATGKLRPVVICDLHL